MLFGGDRDLLDRVLGAADLDRGLVALVQDLAVVVQRSEPRLGPLQKELLADRGSHGQGRVAVVPGQDVKPVSWAGRVRTSKRLIKPNR